MIWLALAAVVAGNVLLLALCKTAAAQDAIDCPDFVEERP